MFSWSVSFEFSFCGEKTRFSHAIATNQRLSSHNFKVKKLNLLTSTSLAIYLLNRGKSSYINYLSMRVNNTFRKIINCFLIKDCHDSPYETSPLFFSKSVQALFFLRALYLTGVRLWQVPEVPLVPVVPVKIMFQSLFGNLLNHLYHYANENLSPEASIFDLHYLDFNYHLLAQKLFSLWNILS